MRVESEYNIGDRVIVRDDLSQDNRYPYGFANDMGCNDEMETLAGSVVTIQRVFYRSDTDYIYAIEEDPHGWAWVDSMFDGLEDDVLMSDGDLGDFSNMF